MPGEPKIRFTDLSRNASLIRLQFNFATSFSPNTYLASDNVEQET